MILWHKAARKELASLVEDQVELYKRYCDEAVQRGSQVMTGSVHEDIIIQLMAPT